MELDYIKPENFEEFIINQGKRDLPDFIYEIDELNNYNYEFNEIIPPEIEKDKHQNLINAIKISFLIL